MLFVESSQASDDDNCLYINLEGSRLNGKVYFAPNVCLASYDTYDDVYSSSVLKCINDESVQLQVFLNNERCSGTANTTTWYNVSDGYDLNCASTAQDCSIKTRAYFFLDNEPNCNNLSAAEYSDVVDVYGMCYQWSSGLCSKTIGCQIGMQTIAFYKNDNCDCNGQVSFISNITSHCHVDVEGTEYYDVSTTCNIPHSNQRNFNSNNNNYYYYYNNNDRIWNKPNWNEIKKKLDVFNTLKHEIMVNAQRS